MTWHELKLSGFPRMQLLCVVLVTNLKGHSTAEPYSNFKTVMYIQPVEFASFIFLSRRVASICVLYKHEYCSKSNWYTKRFHKILSTFVGLFDIKVDAIPIHFVFVTCKLIHWQGPSCFCQGCGIVRNSHRNPQTQIAFWRNGFVLDSKSDTPCRSAQSEKVI